MKTAIKVLNVELENCLSLKNKLNRDLELVDERIEEIEKAISQLELNEVAI